MSLFLQCYTQQAAVDSAYQVVSQCIPSGLTVYAKMVSYVAVDSAYHVVSQCIPSGLTVHTKWSHSVC